MSGARQLLLWTLVAALAACGEPPAPRALVCAATSQCPSGYHCGAAGVCVGDVTCTSDTSCCLAERCEQGVCRPRQSCSAAVPCPGSGQQCLHGVCVARACTQPSDCGGGQSCLWGLCVAKVPCGGQCAAGSACAARLDRCVPAAAPACPKGTLAVLVHEPEQMPEGCANQPNDTACLPLPAIAGGQRGDPGELLVSDGQLLHISYDRTYGDVVLARHAATPPFVQQGSLQVIAGLPSAALVVGAVDGPRGGIAEPGPDVGAALAACNGPAATVHLVARDRSLDGLRYLRWSKGEVVADYPLATQPAGIGTAVAIALSSSGQPQVLAFAPAAADASPPRPSRLLLWSAKSALPQDAAGWSARELDSEAAASASKPCGGGCGAKEACVVAGKASQCATVSQDCAGCWPSQVCSQGLCRDRAIAAPGLLADPPGRGAHLALHTMSSGTVAAAAYSPAGRDLALYRFDGAAVTKTLVSPGAVGSSDAGRFVRLAEGPGGRLWAACEDSDRGRLLWLRETATGPVWSIVDDGARPDGAHRVGAGVGWVRHPAGGLLFAHQDTRRADLLLQRLPQPGSTPASALPQLRSVIESTDAAGFSPSIVQVGSKAWVLASTTLRIEPSGQVTSSVRLRELVWAGD